MIKIIEEFSDGIKLFSLKDEKLEVVVSNYGATIIKILFADKNQVIRDLVYGYDDIYDYGKYDAYLGALVGRVANRIGRGNFELNGQVYNLAINNGPNSLHGGIKGFSYQIFDYKIEDNKLKLTYVSKDGEEGYPGEMTLTAVYQIRDSKLIIDYYATSTKDTLINITNHSYFNLNGDASLIHDHELMISASHYAKIDPNGLPTGELNKVDNTAFDFRKPTIIGDLIQLDDYQLQLGKGYDHPFIFDTKNNQVVLFGPKTGIELTVSTSLPQAQIYTANYLDGRIGKYGQEYHGQTAICIETQNMPDSIHLEKEPSVILKADSTYHEFTSYEFKLR